MKFAAIALVSAAGAGAGFGLTFGIMSQKDLLSGCQEEVEIRRLAAMPSVPETGPYALDL